MTENNDFNNIENDSTNSRNEKRFKLSEPNGAYLIDDNRPYAHWINDDDKIVDLLNILHNENMSLKRDLDNIYLLIGKGDWSGLVDYLMNNEPKVQYSIKKILEDLE